MRFSVTCFVHSLTRRHERFFFEKKTVVFVMASVHSALSFVLLVWGAHANTPDYQNLGESCWDACNDRQGPCPTSFCGEKGKCCRKDWRGMGCNGLEGKLYQHVCVVMITANPTPAPTNRTNPTPDHSPDHPKLNLPRSGLPMDPFSDTRANGDNAVGFVACNQYANQYHDAANACKGPAPDSGCSKLCICSGTSHVTAECDCSLFWASMVAIVIVFLWCVAFFNYGINEIDATALDEYRGTPQDDDQKSQRLARAFAIVKYSALQFVLYTTFAAMLVQIAYEPFEPTGLKEEAANVWSDIIEPMPNATENRTILKYTNFSGIYWEVIERVFNGTKAAETGDFGSYSLSRVYVRHRDFLGVDVRVWYVASCPLNVFGRSGPSLELVCLFLLVGCVGVVWGYHLVPGIHVVFTDILLGSSQMIAAFCNALQMVSDWVTGAHPIHLEPNVFTLRESAAFDVEEDHRAEFRREFYAAAHRGRPARRWHEGQ